MITTGFLGGVLSITKVHAIRLKQARLQHSLTRQGQFDQSRLSENHLHPFVMSTEAGTPSRDEAVLDEIGRTIAWEHSSTVSRERRTVCTGQRDRERGRGAPPVALSNRSHRSCPHGSQTLPG